MILKTITRTRTLKGGGFGLTKSLCDVRLHVFAINPEFLFPFLHSWILPWWSER